MRNRNQKLQDQDHYCKMQQKLPHYSNTLGDTSRTDKNQQSALRSGAQQFQSLLYKWQTELKIFFLSYRKPLNSDTLASFQDKLKIAVNWIGGGPSVAFQEYNKKNENIQDGNNKTSFRYGRLRPVQEPKICILRLQSYHMFVFLQVTVIDLHSRIQFSVGLNKRMNELQIVLDRIIRTCYPLLFLIYDRNGIEQFLGKKKIMLDTQLDKLTPTDFMKNSWDSLEEMQYWRSGSKNIFDNQVYNKHLKAFENVLQKYAFIRQSLSQNLCNINKTLLPYLQLKITILSYNLSSTMVHLDNDSYKAQVQKYLPHLSTFISNLKKNCSRNKEPNSNQHYPMTLQNAHVCWRCKEKSFVGCSTCTTIEAKTVALCLNCYCPYHQTSAVQTRAFIIGYKSYDTSVSKWQKIDLEVQRSIWRQFMSVDLHGSNWLVKKQQ